MGQTVNSLSRRADCGRGYSSQLVGKAIKKYGWDNITKEVFECSSPEEMDQLERQLILKYSTMNPTFGYNCESGGNFKKCVSEDTKEKIRLSKSGINNPNFGKPRSKETKEKISKSKMGHTITEQTRQKLCENSGSAKKVICLETKIIYSSAMEVQRQFKEINASSFRQRYLNNTKEYRDTHTRAGFHWAWLEDYNKEQKE